MVWFIDQFINAGDLTNVFTTVDVITVLILSTVLTFLAAKTYIYIHEGVSYSRGYVHTLVMFGVLVSMVMLIIGSNIARAFTLVGALSIIRFRNAIKDTRDLGFIFYAMIIGMSIGTRFYLLGIIMTLFVSGLLIVMAKTGFAERGHDDEVLKITFPSNEDIEKKAESILRQNVKHYQLVNIDTINKELSELVYLIKFNKKVSNKSFLIKRLKEINGNHPVYIYGTEHLVY